MDTLQFETHKKFFLVKEGWEAHLHENIVKLLDNVIATFYDLLNIDIITHKQVFVNNSNKKKPPSNNPVIIDSSTYNEIFLNSNYTHWDTYSYQFSHELCHHVIDFFYSNQFGWFEETICELASIFVLDRMSTIWENNPPYPNWQRYSSKLRDYASNVKFISEINNSIPFHNWLSDNLDELYKDRYRRADNVIVAVQLLPIFEKNPELWKAIQYLKYINVTEDMAFSVYMKEWIQQVPSNLQEPMKEIVQTLIKE